MTRLTAVARALRPHAGTIAVASALLLVTAGFWAWEAATEVHTVSHETLHAAWREEAHLTHSALITHDSPAWSKGDVVGSGSAGYFLRASPEVNLAFHWRHVNDPELEGTARVNLSILVQETSRDGKEYWSFTRHLGEHEAHVGAGEHVTLHTPMDMASLVSNISRTQQALGGQAGQVHLELKGFVTFEGRNAQGPVSVASRFDAPVIINTPVYILPSPSEATWSRDHVDVTTTESHHVGGLEAAKARQGVLPGLTAGTAGLALAWVVRRLTPPLDPHTEDEERFKDWIVDADGPVAPSRGARVVGVRSLEALANLAAEGRTRVVRDTTDHRYYVFLPDVTYRFNAPPPAETEPTPPPAVQATGPVTPRSAPRRPEAPIRRARPVRAHAHAPMEEAMSPSELDRHLDAFLARFWGRSPGTGGSGDGARRLR